MGEKGFNKRFVKYFSMGVTKSTGEAEYKKMYLSKLCFGTWSM